MSISEEWLKGIPPAAVTLFEMAQEILDLRAELSELRAKEVTQTSVEPDAYRMFDGEGVWNYTTELPSEESIAWTNRYGRKWEPLYTAPPAQAVSDHWTDAHIRFDKTTGKVQAFDEAALLLGEYDSHNEARDALVIYADKLNKQAVSDGCKACGGTGFVDDGELTHSEGGTPYLNGPIKCVKDCPACAKQKAQQAVSAPDRTKMAQAASDFFANLDNGDGTIAFDNCSSDDIDALVYVMLAAAPSPEQPK